MAAKNLKSKWMSYFRYAAFAALVYVVPVSFFVNRSDYSNGWLLFYGCLFFMLAIAVFMFSFNNKRNENASTRSMMVAGLSVTLLGVAIAVVACFVLLLLTDPGFLGSPTPQKVLQDAPSTLVKGNTNGLSFMVFMTATGGNFCVGTFVTILFPFSLKRDQTKAKGKV